MMKLDANQKNSIEEQFGTEAVADDHPAMGKLKEVFGDHTFFLDSGGLNIIEPHPDAATSGGAVIKLASWTEDGTQLKVHDPELLPVTVNLGGGDTDQAG
jgi:hypothetical protein